MLDEFIVTNREAIIAGSLVRVTARRNVTVGAVELQNGIPIFLDQLGDALRLAKSSDVVDHERMKTSAGQHGVDLLRLGLSVGQVVKGYGDVCQTVTELAIAQMAPISGEEFRTLNLCLDDAIAGAVTAYALQRDRLISDQGTERLGILAHELRNLLNVAMLAFESIKGGHVAANGSTGMLLDRSLLGLRDLIDLSLAEVRLDAGIELREPFSVAAFVEEVEIGAQMQAQARGSTFTVAPVDRSLIIRGDRTILAAALSNLLQNAFKFTRKLGHVALTTRAIADRVLFEVEDECGGLPPGKTEELFRPFEQRNRDRSGVGLGLVICRKAADANGGRIRVRDLPGKGCVFTLDLPRHPTAESSASPA